MTAHTNDASAPNIKPSHTPTRVALVSASTIPTARLITPATRKIQEPPLCVERSRGWSREPLLRRSTHCRIVPASTPLS